MKKPELTKEESEVYLKIVTQGNMDDMFYFAYAIGRERFAQEQLEKFFPVTNDKK